VPLGPQSRQRQGQSASFNGDPHPGNYLFHGGGKVAFLDFGMVKHFTEADASVRISA
jgi:predicted unusual protein kinase regulating ubiquinone biosynthesis (AarF/ABC1/UbiB family)